MKLLNLLAARIIEDPEIISNIKAEYINDHLELTERGTRILLTILFLKHKKEMAAQANEYLAQRKESVA